MQGGSETSWYRNVQVVKRPGSEPSKMLAKHTGGELTRPYHTWYTVL